MNHHTDDVIDADVIVEAERIYGKGEERKPEREAFLAGYRLGWDERFRNQQTTGE